MHHGVLNNPLLSMQPNYEDETYSNIKENLLNPHRTDKKMQST